jgi:hypothetical protein
MKDNMLEVGDILHTVSNSLFSSERRIIIVGKVTRVTATLAFVGDLKLRRDYGIGTTVPGNHDVHTRKTYYLVTDENRDALVKQVKKEKTQRIVSGLKVETLTDSQLERIAAILQEPKEVVP